jgi:hypothetical protein
MVRLENDIEIITNFILDSIEKFKNHNGEFTSLGIYCCPTYNWITTCFNIDRSLEDAFYNCPDFEFVEFTLLELERWEREYEMKTPAFKFENSLFIANAGMGDEALNQFIFEFLSSVITSIKSEVKKEILLQMLDSEYNKVF